LRRSITSHATVGKIWAEDPDTSKRRDLSLEEHQAFWTWAAVEVLRHTGVRIEELSELSHHSLIHYTVPATGELIPLLQIAPSKTDTERLLVISPELADVLSAIISRVRDQNGAVPLVVAYDYHERIWNPPMPLLFQRRLRGEPAHRRTRGPRTDHRRAGRHRTHRRQRATATVRAARLPPDLDHRRDHARDAAAHRPTRRRAPRHQRHHGLQSRLPRRSHQRPSRVPRPPPSPTTQRGYRTPTDEEWDEFLGHFERRKVSLGTCGRAYATPCIHEHSCIRCPLLRPDPAQRTRLVQIRDNLLARIAEAHTEGWLGEVDGLNVSLAAARIKLAQLDHHARTRQHINIGMPGTST
jgi:hypothetical protein